MNAPRYQEKFRSAQVLATISLLRAFLPWPQFLIKHPSRLSDDALLHVTFEKTCSGRGQVYQAAVAADEPTRRKGLSNRKNPLAPDEGMIFVFEAPQRASFWMKETLIPLQLVFVRPDGGVLETREMPVEKNPQNPKNYYTATQPVVVAIELAPKALRNTTWLQLCIQIQD